MNDDKIHYIVNYAKYIHEKWNNNILLQVSGICACSCDAFSRVIIARIGEEERIRSIEGKKKEYMTT